MILMSIEEYKQIMMIQYKRIFVQSLAVGVLPKQKYAIYTQKCTEIRFSQKLRFEIKIVELPVYT